MYLSAAFPFLFLLRLFSFEGENLLNEVKGQETLTKEQAEIVTSPSGGFLQTAQTWANAGVCSASCVHVLGSVFVCLLFVVCCLFVVCLLFVVCCLLFVVCCLFVVYCLLFIVYCLLFIVCFTSNLGDWVS